jgi:phosphatidylinositol glycan class B
MLGAVEEKDTSKIPRKRKTEIPKYLFLYLWAFRVFNALIIRTAFDPDETYQSLEVAHNKVFGNGYLTWEWKLGIRSSIHVWMFAFIYKVLDITGLSDSILLISAPYIMQSYLAALSDYFCILLADRLFGYTVAKWTMFAIQINWFNFYCLTRTYSNSFEASLTMIALYYWPSQRVPVSTRRDLRIGLAIAAISSLARPTSLIVWQFMGIKLLFDYPAKVPIILYDVVITAYPGFYIDCSL